MGSEWEGRRIVVRLGDGCVNWCGGWVREFVAGLHDNYESCAKRYGCCTKLKRRARIDMESARFFVGNARIGVIGRRIF
jgi:hypothetical protein